MTESRKPLATTTPPTTDEGAVPKAAHWWTHPGAAFTMQAAPTLLSVLALALSVLTFYRQFFYVRDEVTAVVLNNISRPVKPGWSCTPIVVSNGGTRTVVVVELSARVWFDGSRMRGWVPGGGDGRLPPTPDMLPATLKAGDAASFCVPYWANDSIEERRYGRDHVLYRGADVRLITADGVSHRAVWPWSYNVRDPKGGITGGSMRVPPVNLVLDPVIEPPWVLERMVEGERRRVGW